MWFLASRKWIRCFFSNTHSGNAACQVIPQTRQHGFHSPSDGSQNAGNDFSFPEKEQDGRRALTYCDSVDGVGITIIVAVVIVLTTIATGHYEDAPEAPAAGYHTVLQGSLQRGDSSVGAAFPSILLSEALCSSALTYT